ncbi:MAG: response regulator [Syntrophothermus sp.]
MSVKVAVVEDHKEFREAVGLMLQSSHGFMCAGLFGAAEDALENITEADVILLDINLPGISGIDAIRPLKALLPAAYILILTICEDEQNIFQAILEGADGYLLKKTPPSRLLQAIEDVAGGGLAMTPVIARQALSLFKKFIPGKNLEFKISERELEVLKLLVEGASNDEIAGKLYISIQTVRNHVRHIYEKLHVHSRSQAVVKAIRQGIL